MDYSITSLPVDLLKITRTAGIKVIRNSDVRVLSKGESGMCLIDGQTWYLVYDDTCTLGRRRFTIAHELGHIFLGHELKKGYHGRVFSKHKPLEEIEADMFASRLVSPACVLWGLNLFEPEQIAIACGISITAATISAKRLATYFKGDTLLKTALERQVFDQFKGFIYENKKMPALTASIGEQGRV